MMKLLDFSNLHENGFKINQLRLFHSLKFRGLNFMKNKQVFVDSDDKMGEKNLILEYITETMEINYTVYILFGGLTITVLSLLLLTTFVSDITILHRMISVGFSFVCWLVSKKGKENFVMTHVGYGLAESMYDIKIKDKYNL